MGGLQHGGPLVTPWKLHCNWPGSELVLVSEAGHDARDPGMSEAIVAATNGFRPASIKRPVTTWIEGER